MYFRGRCVDLALCLSGGPVGFEVPLLGWVVGFGVPLLGWVVASEVDAAGVDFGVDFTAP